MNNIVLIGMPAAGKSTTGVVLAKTLGLPFVDTDFVIQAQEDKLLQEIITRDGTGRFIDIEEKVTLDLACGGYVIATGGSVIYSDAAMRHLKKTGFIIYLKLNYREIEKRISSITSRGVVIGEKQKLEDLYREREPLYRKYADLVLDCDGRDMEGIINDINNQLPETFKNLK